MLAVFTFVKQFKHYLLGRSFKIRTDHKALTWLRSWKNPNKSQYFTWITELEVYDFIIEHRYGQFHKNADYMSKPNCEQWEVAHDDPKKRRNVKVIVEDSENYLRLIEDDMDMKKETRYYGISPQ